MNKPRARFCELYRPIGALLLALAILFLLLRSCTAPTPTVAVPTVQVQATVPALPTVAPPTVPPLTLPKLNVPSVADFTAEGVKLSGVGQPGATVEVWDGAVKVGTATVGADGAWSIVGKLAEGAHKLAVRTVDAAGKVLNEAAAVEVTAPKAQAPAAKADLAASGQEYIVKAGDWLSKLAQTYYGDATLYTLIVDGTNAKAAADPSFTKITNPDLIVPGQKLWIPPKPAGG
jgi:nucleoid-associated protein YgaU